MSENNITVQGVEFEEDIKTIPILEFAEILKQFNEKLEISFGNTYPDSLTIFMKNKEKDVLINYDDIILTINQIKKFNDERNYIENRRIANKISDYIMKALER